MVWGVIIGGLTWIALMCAVVAFWSPFTAVKIMSGTGAVAALLILVAIILFGGRHDDA